jgi:hypothetical protein
MVNELTVHVARSLLPENEEARYDRLFDYFGSRLQSCSLHDDGWLLTLGWPKDAARYKDPNILKGLSWWSPKMTIGEVPFAVRQEVGFQLALNDCWSLLAWSRWLAGRAAKDDLPTDLVLLHVDDHDDLMSPLIVNQSQRWVDAITKKEFSLLKPGTVSSAIESGAVGVGSFIAPLLHQVPRVHIRHLCVTGYITSRRGAYSVDIGERLDDLLATGASRQSLKLTSASPERAVAGHSYHVASNPSDWLVALPNAPVLLHIDLDFFNNRFNGDSDWRNRPDRHDPVLPDILASVDAVFASLSAERVLQKVVDMTVAISPRFFPAEFWGPTVNAIGAYARNLPVTAACEHN